MSNELNKAESSEKTITRPISSEKGQPHIVTSSRFIQELKKDDLKMPKRFCTYENMMADDAVSNSVDVTNIQVISALNRGEFKPKGNSQESKIAADFLNYCIRNMGYGTWLEIINTAATDLINGFSIANIVTTRSTTGLYRGAQVLHKLSPRHPKSVHGWVWDKNNRELKGFVQKPMLTKLKEPKKSDYQSDGIFFSEINNGFLSTSNYPYLDLQQILLFRHNPTFGNPQGDSPLNHCYDAWVEKKLVEHYEIIGVSKDFGGLIVVRVPSELIEQANNAAQFPEAYKEYLQLQQDASDLQAGKSTQIVLTSDTDEISKKFLYDLELKGIDGGGKQYSSSDIIDQKRKSIYNVFGTGFLLLGQNGHGSNALAGSQMTTHDYFIDRNIMWKCDVINNQLAPRLLAVNGVHLTWDKMPEFVPADPSKPDLDTISKVIQRVKSVGGLTPQALESIYVAAGWPTEGIEDLSFDDGDTSRGGESQGSSGVGGSQSGGANSSTNTENKALNYSVDYETDSEIVAVEETTGEPLFIQKEGK